MRSEFRNKLDMPFVADFKFLNKPVRIASNTEEVFDEIVSLWSDFRCKFDEHCSPSLRYEIQYWHGERGMASYCVYQDGRQTLRATSAQMIPVHIDSSIVTWLIRNNDENILFHASAVSFLGCGLLMPGPTNSGKTTLMLGLICAGGLYIADEMCPYDSDRVALMSFPKGLILRAGSLCVLRARASGEDVPWPNQSIPKNECIHLPEIFPECLGSSTPLSAVIFPSYQIDARIEVSLLAKREALQCLIRNAWNISLVRERAMDGLLALASNIDCFKMTFGDLNASVEAIARQIVPHISRSRGGAEMQAIIQ